jgi:hypothetical protein
MMFVYLFRQRHTKHLALTTDVTGRNIPPLTASTRWIFVEALDINKFAPPWDITDFQGVLLRLKAFGYYIFGADC